MQHWRKSNESGQALVLVLLSLAVVLTLVLFVLSRTITDITVSSRQEEAVRAFSAAEAGIERALVIGSGSSGSIQIGDASYEASVTSYAEGSFDFNYPINMSSGESATTWFVAHDDDGTTVCDGLNPCFTGSSIKVCWGRPGTSSSASTTPAIEVSVLYASTPNNLATAAIGRSAFDPNTNRATVGTSGVAPNGFSAVDVGTCTIDEVAYQFHKTIQFSDLGIPSSAYNNAGGLQLARVRMFYNTDRTHNMGVTVNLGTNSTLPSQGANIISTGTAGESNRRLEVFQGWPEVPSVLEYALYSGGDLTK